MHAVDSFNQACKTTDYILIQLQRKRTSGIRLEKKFLSSLTTKNYRHLYSVTLVFKHAQEIIIGGRKRVSSERYVP